MKTCAAEIKLIEFAGYLFSGHIFPFIMTFLEIWLNNCNLSGLFNANYLILIHAWDKTINKKLNKMCTDWEVYRLKAGSTGKK